MKYLNKLQKVNESITINRYDNGYMVEVTGRDDDNDWKCYSWNVFDSHLSFTVIIMHFEFGGNKN